MASDQPPALTPQELAKWQFHLRQANDNNIWCHCRQCEYEWVASDFVACDRCGSRNVQHIPCWQFPDD
ncbi:MAG TPA: hypothetical protein IGS53_08975 [Leptolyngbyaceae cyanobacterium M33_DOE_097]|uniref:Uncharacterized protein n=1 Tax=Oscillatoriales cyanobacterium SpSt-418 TaxID=2282169 RepID=A0A7C3PEJ2_9CYAN|nr:hypothetical protein [Leptolyngbyaceae cyanobacterium M33_DOE_097]